jgi:hypothetical protein
LQGLLEVVRRVTNPAEHEQLPRPVVQNRGRCAGESHRAVAEPVPLAGEPAGIIDGLDDDVTEGGPAEHLQGRTGEDRHGRLADESAVTHDGPGRLQHSETVTGGQHVAARADRQQRDGLIVQRDRGQRAGEAAAAEPGPGQQLPACRLLTPMPEGAVRADTEGGELAVREAHHGRRRDHGGPQGLRGVPRPAQLQHAGSVLCGGLHLLVRVGEQVGRSGVVRRSGGRRPLDIRRIEGVGRAGEQRAVVGEGEVERARILVVRTGLDRRDRGVAGEREFRGHRRVVDGQPAGVRRGDDVGEGLPAGADLGSADRPAAVVLAETEMVDVTRGCGAEQGVTTGGHHAPGELVPTGADQPVLLQPTLAGRVVPESEELALRLAGVERAGRTGDDQIEAAPARRHHPTEGGPGGGLLVVAGPAQTPGAVDEVEVTALVNGDLVAVGRGGV